jgi:hypothetical protein|nr:MAG TPA: hypothetical protein [Caudoviricetes sp.]
MAEKPTIPDFPTLPDFGQMITQACEIVASVRGIPYDFNGTLSLENKFVVLFKTVKEMFNAQDALVKSYKELYEFINTYFDNLDVQEEVNKKLDELVKNGTLSHLLSNIVGNNSYPTFVSSINNMTDTKLVYILASNGHIYYYNNAWVDSGLIYGAFASYTPSNIIVTPDNVANNFNDINNAPLNKTAFLFNMTSNIMANLPVTTVDFGAVSTFQCSDHILQPGGYQLLVTKNGIYSRINFGSFNQHVNWTEWIHPQNAETNYFKTFNFFRSFCTIGDSLSVGYHTLKNGTVIPTDLEHSWPSYIKNKYHNTVYWSGQSGATCKSWLNATENSWGINYLKSIPPQPLYLLCMGANEAGITIGSHDDIGSDRDTLYGYVSKVINEVRKYAPNCYIISTGISRGQGTGSAYEAINNVYKDMENFFENYFYADCMSELNSKPFTDLYNNYHYTPLGYSALAEFFEKKFDSVINENITKFLYA